MRRCPTVTGIRRSRKKKLPVSSKNCVNKMPLCAVLDSTVLVSAFLTPGGAADALVDQAKAGRITGVVAEDILAETARVLLTAERIRQRYPYTDADVQGYLQSIRQA